MEELYTQKEAIEILKITRQTLTNWHKRKIIKFVKIGKKSYVRKSEVERLIKENEI